MDADGPDPSRTVVVSGVPDLLPAHRMRDKLTVHFQSRGRSRGGDVEVVAYPTDMKGVAFVTFDRAADAETVVLKEQQILTDSAFPEEHALTVFPFTTDVFFYVTSADVDLSAFDGDQASLIGRLRKVHRSLRFQSWPHQRKATVEGPFSALRALRADLMSRAGQLKATLPAARVRLGEFPPDPRVISHHELPGPVSRSHSEAKREPEGSNGLSAPLQSAGEGGELQNSGRRKVPSFSDTGAEAGEESGAGSRRRLTAGHGAGRTQRYRDEASGTDPPQNVSSQQPPVNGAIQTHGRADGNCAAETRAPLDYLEQSSQSLSVAHKTRLADVPSSYAHEGGAGKTGDHPQDTCIWVDSHILRYMEKFDKHYKRCLRGLNASVEEDEGPDVLRICLAEKEGEAHPGALARLNTLVEHWQSELRVYELRYNRKEHPKEKVMLICLDVETKSKYDQVLYMVEESKVKFVGPLLFSHVFYLTVKQRLEFDKI